MVVWKHRSSEKLQSEADQLLERGDFKGAALIWKHLVERHPGDAQALERLGTLRGLLGAYDLAVRLLTRASEIDPTSYGAFYNLALAYSKLGRRDEAISALQRAIKIEPEMANACGELGRVQEAKGDYQAAIVAYMRGASLSPDDPWLNELVHCKHNICDWDLLEEQHHLLVDRLHRSGQPLDSIVALQISDDPDFQRLNVEAIFSQKYAFPAPASPLRQRSAPARHEGSKGRLRLAYMSGDFRTHATSQLIIELIERHDRSRFEIIGISVGPNEKSPMRRRLKKAFDKFIDCSNLGPAEIAAAVRKQDIQILIDLSGYTDYSLLQVLGFRPAPLQVHYLGFPGTLACPWVDYLVVDPFIVPPGSERHYAEALCYLPNTYQVTSHRALAGETVPSRASQCLPEEAFVFCSFNNQMKLQRATYEVWLDILRRVTGSVLWLFTRNEAALSNLKAYAASRGVAEDRIIAAGLVKAEAHLARQALADLFLDSFPYNGHTTTSDALWAGVPVLTYSGRSFASRVAGSLLRAHGMEDLITSSVSEYADLAVKIALTPGMADDLKARALANRDAYPLFNTERFCRDFETALVKMWQRFERGEPPAGLLASD